MTRIIGPSTKWPRWWSRQPMRRWRARPRTARGRSLAVLVRPVLPDVGKLVEERPETVRLGLRPGRRPLELARQPAVERGDEPRAVAPVEAPLEALLVVGAALEQRVD